MREPLAVSFVVLTCNRRPAVLRLLGQLDRLDDPGVELIAVDNGSSDGTAEAIAVGHPRVRLVALPVNTGVGGRNRGLEIATGDVVVTLDDDMVDFGPDQLAAVRRAFAEAPGLGAVTFTCTWPGTDRVRDWVHRRPVTEADTCFATYEITEGAVAYRRAALATTGLYREDFFISHEGLDLAYRLLDAGWDIAHDGRIRVGHDHRMEGRPGWRRYYFDTRNLFWVAVLHQPADYAAGYLARGLGAMLVYSLRDGHGLAWLQAVRDGLAGLAPFRRERRPWNPQTRKRIREADAHRPGFWTLARRRLGQRNFSLD
ncbi:MAG TPA: glycosyltransferase [Candidatus Krumholzibacteria bacterium]|nr:glycosyltransferase [Candidatus Krumholzibacteria bacterium]